jgi:hypothetical protein
MTEPHGTTPITKPLVLLLMEGLASAVLVGVLLALAWMIGAADQPAWAGWGTTEP